MVTVLALIIQTGILSNSMNMLHFNFGTSYPFYSTEQPSTNTVTQLAGEENAKFTFTTTNKDVCVSPAESKPSHSVASGTSRSINSTCMNRIQGGILRLHSIYRIAGKFGSLAVCVETAKSKSANFFMHACTYGDTVSYRQI